MDPTGIQGNVFVLYLYKNKLDNLDEVGKFLGRFKLSKLTKK